MKRIIKRTTNLAIALLFILTWTFTCFGYAVDPDEIEVESEPQAEIQLNVDISESAFYEPVFKIFFDDIEWQVFNREGNYNRTVIIPEGQHKVFIYCPSNINDDFVFEYPDSIDTNTTKVLNIKVVNSPDFVVQENDEYDPAPEVETDAEGYQISAPPEIQTYDFSDGEPYGILYLETNSLYACFKDFTYRLVGKDRVYDITFTSPNISQVQAYLPVGEYTETATFNYTLDDDARLPEGITLSWLHTGNEHFFSDTVLINENETTEITDLQIMMNNGSETAEVQSSLFFQQVLQERKAELEQHYFEEVIQPQKPELFPTIEETTQETEQETFAQVIPTPVETPQTHVSIPLIIGIAAAVIILAIVVIVIIKKRREDY